MIGKQETTESEMTSMNTAAEQPIQSVSTVIPKNELDAVEQVQLVVYKAK